MSALDELEEVAAPVPAEKPLCAGCKAWAVECLMPHGEGAIGMCWLCAHAAIAHDCPLRRTAKHECECAPEEIYPQSVIARRRGN